MTFVGFPRGTHYTPVPNPLFGPLLETIEELAELKCTLRALWLLHQKKGYPRFVTAGELISDQVLLTGLNGQFALPQETIRHGMQLATNRGTFLTLAVNVDGKQEQLFFLNDEPGERAVAMIQRGGTDIKGVAPRGRRCRRVTRLQAQHLYYLRAEHRYVDTAPGRRDEGGGAELPVALDRGSLQNSRQP